ncbi:hypothetical protein H4582DRAFT_2126202 [Lactarius indigo]|nr:hypothetical protein H4582DRAFT_2126202 [Lactarius indigo]
MLLCRVLSTLGHRLAIDRWPRPNQSRVTNSDCGQGQIKHSHKYRSLLHPTTIHYLLNSMPDYSSLVRSEASPPASSTLLQGSIRRRSSTHKWSTLSRKPSTESQPATSCRSWDPQNAETGGPNARTFATDPSPARNTSHFTAIPARSHRSSLISSHPGPYPRQRERRPTSVTTSTIDFDDSLHLKAHPNFDDDLASSGLLAAPVAEVSNPVSRFSMKMLLFAKQMPFKAHSGLGSLRRKVLKLRFPTYNLSRSPSPKGRPGALLGSAPKQPFLTAADKLTQKWPRPRSLRSIPSEFRGDLYSSNGLWGLKRVGGWSQADMETALRDSQGLGIDRVGQWTPHKWCLLASVITVFLLGLTFLVFSILTWFAAYPAAPVVLITDSPALTLITFSSSLLLLASLVGVTGTLLNSRPILAVYVLLLFPSFISFVSVGYVTYKKATFSLDARASEAWNLWYSAGARTVLQGALGCCGWSDPLHAAVASGTCYPRSPLPGCHGPLGITPARYRLTVDDVLSMGLVDQKKAGLPLPPFPASTSYGAFREDRRSFGGVIGKELPPFNIQYGGLVCILLRQRHSENPYYSVTCLRIVSACHFYLLHFWPGHSKEKFTTQAHQVLLLCSAFRVLARLT